MPITSDIKMRPKLWLGAYSPGALALPDAAPTPSQLYAPRGVFLTDDRLIAVDSGNHRVLIWHSIPTQDGQAADVVLGQPDFYSEGPNAGGRGPEKGLHLPTGVGLYEGKLFIADAWNHRVLVWNQVPENADAKPDYVIGQANLSETTENRGGEINATGLYWPYGLAYIAGWFYITDTGNRRVLIWNGLPGPNQPPDVILGQDAPNLGLENRGTAVGANTFRWPHAVAGNERVVYIADAGNHRILGWTPPPTADRPADLVIGQPDFSRATEWPYGKQGPQALRFPYALALEANTLAVADTANNRVLFWYSLPQNGTFAPADAQIGQKDFDANGENRWDAVQHDTLCWPYGIHLHQGTLAVADSGNNRVMLWDVKRAE